MEKPHIFYTIYRIENDVDVDGLHLLAGYYKYSYDLTGIELPTPCQFSPDRCNWSECELFNGLGEFQEFFDDKVEPEPMKIEHEEYIETIHYKGVSVPIFCDDYGQCFYCIYDNKVLGFGSFQTEYEDEVKAIIDDMDLKKKKKKKKMGGVEK